MKYSPIIVAGPIQHLTDARYFAAEGADWLLADVDPTSEYHIDPNTLKAIKEWVAGPKWVIKGDSLDIDQLLQLGQYVDCNAYIVNDAQRTLNTDTPCWLSIGGTSPDGNATDHYSVFYLEVDDLTDLMIPGNKKLYQQTIIRHGNWSTMSIDIILETIHPLGIVLQGSSEEKVGVKSYDEIEDIYTILKKYLD
ncbi:MAG: hypothetical protein KA010_02795 [Saprospiraceae bacterium]|nr:hypothetical protein [Saprospiraceae bacterium]